MKTNRTLKLITLTAAIFGFAATSFGQNYQDETSATASANIIQAISVTKARDLNFGNIVYSGAGTVTIASTAAGTPSYSAAVYAPAGVEGTRESAQFNVTGLSGAKFSFVVDESVTLSHGDDTMTATLSSDQSENIVLTGGNATVYVGGVLSVGAEQPAGEYSGTFDVTVTYE